MRRLAWFGFLVAGCGGNTTVDPCASAGAGDICIAATVTGNVNGTLDQLDFAIEQPMHMTASSTSSAFSLPVKVGIVLPSTVTSPVQIALTGLRSGAAVAADSQSVSFSGKRGSVTFTLSTSALPDMAMQPDLFDNRDMEKPNPTLTPSPAMPVGHELEPLVFTVTGDDPAGLSLTTTLMSLPTGANATSGTTAMFSWTPGLADSGMYTINANVTTSDSRMASLPIMFNILNSVDPAPPLTPNDVVSTNPPINPIGDFDNDGKGDLASCTVVGTNYQVVILYGNSKGLPTMMPLPGGATQTYTFPATSTTTTPDNTRLPCLGGDMDGDGFSDAIIQDPSANGGAGQVYILYGTGRANATSASTQLVANGSLINNEKLNNPLFVGHYQPLGNADIVTMTYTTGTNVDILNIFKGVKTRPGAANWPPPEQHPLTASQEPCTKRQIIGLGDFDNNALDDIMMWDKNVGSVTPCTDPATNAKGGFTLISAGQPDKSWVRPATSPLNFGLPPASTLCDVDADGRADLVVSTDPAASDPKAQIYFAPFPVVMPTPPPPVLDPGAAMGVATITATPAGRVYGEAHCVPKFFGPASLLLVDVGDATNPARADIIGASRTPAVLQSIPNPDSMDKKYGNSFVGVGDFNGDSHRDLLIGAVMGRYWAVYGR